MRKNTNKLITAPLRYVTKHCFQPCLPVYKCMHFRFAYSCRLSEITPKNRFFFPFHLRNLCSNTSSLRLLPWVKIHQDLTHRCRWDATVHKNKPMYTNTNKYTVVSFNVLEVTPYHWNLLYVRVLRNLHVKTQICVLRLT